MSKVAKDKLELYLVYLQGFTTFHSGNTFYAHAPANKTMNFLLHTDDNDAELVWKVKVYNYPTNYSKTYTIKRTSGSNNLCKSITLPKNSKNRIYGVKVTVSSGTLSTAIIHSVPIFRMSVTILGHVISLKFAN